MDQLSPTYLAAMAGQIGSLSAFLGGFAATVLATLLTLPQSSRIATASILCAALSAVAFIVAVVAATAIGSTLHPDAPANMARMPAGGARLIMTSAFFLGMLALLACLGCSGWIRSRAIGWFTSVVAGAGLLAILMLTVRVGA